MGLQKGQNKELKDVLTNTEGVKTYSLNNESNQVYIEYDHNIISYLELENKIANAGLEIETSQN